MDPDAVPYVVVVRTPPTGKPRKKTFNKKKSAFPLPNAMNAALRFLFGEGYILRAPQDGPVRWLVQTHEPYPHGQPYAVDPRGDYVWVADTGSLRRVRRGDAHIDDVDIGAGVMPRSITVAADGTAWAVLELEENAAQGSPPWRAPSSGKIAYGLARVGGDLELQIIATVPHDGVSNVSDSVSTTADGRVLGPHADGAALYSPDGAVQATFPTSRCKYYSPRCAVSPSGQWVISLADDGALRLVDPAGEVRLRPADFGQVMSMAISDDGTAIVGGCREDWGLFEFQTDGRERRLSREVFAALSPDGQSVAEARYGAVTLRAAGEDAPLRTSPLPVLGMSRSGLPRFGPDGALFVRTDVHTLAELDVSRLALPQE